MQTYISLLRGINVSGQKRIKMDELKAAYEALGLKQVTSYIQSGNVIFKSPAKDRQKLAVKIEKTIEQHFAYSVSVLIRDLDEFKKLIDANPFPAEGGVEPDKLHLTFLSAVPDKSLLQKMAELESGKDKFSLAGENIYLYCPGGYGRTKLTNNYFEKKLALSATTRNWNTVQKLYGLAEHA